MRIGALARQSACTVEQIRFYEAEGLLPPPLRSDNGYRVYAPEHAQRLLFIRRCRNLNMSLKDIGILLGFAKEQPANCDCTNRLIDQHRHTIESKITELQALYSQLTMLRKRCNGESQTCGILQALAE